MPSSPARLRAQHRRRRARRHRPASAGGFAAGHVRAAGPRLPSYCNSRLRRKRGRRADRAGDVVMLIGVVAERDPQENARRRDARRRSRSSSPSAPRSSSRAGAGLAAGVTDAEYAAAGARIGVRRRGARRRRRAEGAPPERGRDGRAQVAARWSSPSMDPYGHDQARSRRSPRPASPPSRWS